MSADLDGGRVWDEIHSRIEHTSTALKIIDFLWTNRWFILLFVLVLILWPRRRAH